VDRGVTRGAPASPRSPLAGTGDLSTEVRRGTVYGFLAYGIWGLFPLYFAALAPAGAFEVLANRILWTLAVCVLVLLVRRDLAWVRPFTSRPRLLGGTTIAGLLIAANWTVYVLAVLTGRTYEAALGYFLNPVVTVGLGVLILRERLRPAQWAAVAIGFVAAVYLTVAGGVFPWIPLALAFSFGLYGLTKKKVGATLAPMHSLAAETTVLAPVAVGILLVLRAQGETTFTGYGGWHTTLLVLSGVVTAVPLLFFAAAARRIPLVTVGLIQFITPTLQLVVGVTLLGEDVSGRLWVGFGIVWVALVVLTWDSLRTAHSARRAAAAAAAAAIADDERAEASEPCP
jgi:chloramphenicol-sensitive protein RarD